MSSRKCHTTPDLRTRRIGRPRRSCAQVLAIVGFTGRRVPCLRCLRPRCPGPARAEKKQRQKGTGDSAKRHAPALSRRRAGGAFGAVESPSRQSARVADRIRAGMEQHRAQTPPAAGDPIGRPAPRRPASPPPARASATRLRRWLCEKHKVVERRVFTLPGPLPDRAGGSGATAPAPAQLSACEGMTPCPRAGCGKPARPVR